MKLNKRQKEVFKQDPITIAVDKCNEILKELGLCVSEVNYDSLESYQKNAAKYINLENGKLVTNETYIEIWKTIGENNDN